MRSLRARYPGARLVAAFEPRSNTARTGVMQAGFVEALATADEVFLGAVSRAEALAAGERFDAAAVIAALAARGVGAATAETNAALLGAMVARVVEGTVRAQVVVFFTNGSFGGIIGGLVRAVS